MWSNCNEMSVWVSGQAPVWELNPALKTQTTPQDCHLPSYFFSVCGGRENNLNFRDNEFLKFHRAFSNLCFPTWLAECLQQRPTCHSGSFYWIKWKSFRTKQVLVEEKVVKKTLVSQGHVLFAGMGKQYPVWSYWSVWIRWTLWEGSLFAALWPYSSIRFHTRVWTC